MLEFAAEVFVTMKFIRPAPESWLEGGVVHQRFLKHTGRSVEDFQWSGKGGVMNKLKSIHNRKRTGVTSAVKDAYIGECEECRAVLCWWPGFECEV